MKNRVGFISDIHIGSNTQALEYLIRLCVEKELNYLLIAGDISNRYTDTLYFVETLEDRTKTKVFFIAGNHDLYTTLTDKSSKEIYETFSNSHQFLPVNNIILDDYIILGDTGWYDYSFRDSRFSIEELEPKRYGGKIYNDKTYIKWDNKTDTQINDFMLRSIEKQLIKAKTNYPNKKIIAVSHVVPFFEYIMQKDISWNYFNAFMGSMKLGQLYEKYEVSISVFGHIHSPVMESGVICAPLGHPHEQLGLSSLEAIRERLTIKRL